MANKTILKHEFAEYTPYLPFLLRNRTEAEAYAEYSKLRKILYKRMKRIEQVEPESGFVKNFKKDFPTIKEIKEKGGENALVELGYALKKSARAIVSRETTVSGYRRGQNEAVERLRQSGLTFVNPSNVNEVSKFIRHVQSRIDRRIAYEVGEDVFKWSEKKGLDPYEVFNAYMEFKHKEEEAGRKVDEFKTFSRKFNIKGGYKNASSGQILKEFEKFAEKIKK